jgi:predicted GTPase
LFDRLRARLTQAFILKVGRAAIDLYAGRLALSDEEMRVAQEVDAPATNIAIQPVRLILVGQVNAGKSSLVNALALETHCAVGPVPTTSQATEYRLELEGRPAVSLVDMAGLTEGDAPEFLAQAERADLVLWVASAMQPARSPDRRGLDEYRSWAAQLASKPIRLSRRPPPVLLALTHVDLVRPASEWAPPYDVEAPEVPKARNIRAAIDSAAKALEISVQAVVPVALPPGIPPYNIDSLWARIASELPDARRTQLDRLRVGAQRSSLRTLLNDLGRTGRTVMQAAAAADQER